MFNGNFMKTQKYFGMSIIVLISLIILTVSVFADCSNSANIPLNSVSQRQSFAKAVALAYLNGGSGLSSNHVKAVALIAVSGNTLCDVTGAPAAVQNAFLPGANSVFAYTPSINFKSIPITNIGTGAGGVRNTVTTTTAAPTTTTVAPTTTTTVATTTTTVATTTTTVATTTTTVATTTTTIVTTTTTTTTIATTTTTTTTIPGCTAANYNLGADTWYYNCQVNQNCNTVCQNAGAGYTCNAAANWVGITTCTLHTNLGIAFASCKTAAAGDLTASYYNPANNNVYAYASGATPTCAATPAAGTARICPCLNPAQQTCVNTYGGTWYNNQCWFLGAAGANCNTVCASRPGNPTCTLPTTFSGCTGTPFSLLGLSCSSTCTSSAGAYAPYDNGVGTKCNYATGSSACGNAPAPTERRLCTCA